MESFDKFVIFLDICYNKYPDLYCFDIDEVFSILFSNFTGKDFSELRLSQKRTEQKRG